MKKRGITIILSITLLVVIFYGYRYLQIPVKTQVAMITEHEDVISADAYVVRKETVYKADTTGTLYNYVSEGARVSKSMCISTVYKGSIDQNLIQELNNVDKKIDKFESALAYNQKFTTYSGNIESSIENIKYDIIDAVINNNISSIPDYKNSINILNNSLSETDTTTLQELKAKKRSLESQLSGEKSDIYSTMSGIFSQNVDGFEQVLTPESVMQFKASDFSGLGVPGDGLRITNSVNAGENVCKVVDNHNWYVLTTVPADRIDDLKAKKNVNIRFENLPGVEVLATVLYISEEEEPNSDCVVVLKSERYLEGVYGIRFGKVDIVLNSYTGYEIPVYAVRVIDNKKGVMIYVSGKEIFCECDVIYNNEMKGTVILYPAKECQRELSIGDRILLGDKNSENG